MLASLKDRGIGRDWLSRFCRECEAASRTATNAIGLVAVPSLDSKRTNIKRMPPAKTDAFLSKTDAFPPKANVFLAHRANIVEDV